jgi:arabinofuranosyltransferase
VPCGLTLVPVLLLLVLGWQHRWMSDDGFIHLRVVQQVLNGHGPVFNIGERVEASTSPLWVAVLVVAAPIPGVALPWKAVLLGIALSAVGLYAARRASLQLVDWGGRRGFVLPLGAMVVVALPPFWDFASSGLETGLVFAWIGGCCWWCAYRCTSEAPPVRWAEVGGAALLGLGWLIRPDLAIYSVVFGAVVLAAVWRDSRRRRRVGVALAMGLTPLAYQLFRMGYYAMLVPNTALAKESGRAQWAQGWTYLRDLVSPYQLWLPAAALIAVLVMAARRDLAWGDRRRAAARVAPAVAAVAHGAFVMRAGGDFMHGRLLLPAVFGLFAPVGVPVTWDQVRALRALPNRRSLITRRAVVTAGAAAVLLVWGVVCVAGLRRGQYPADVLGTNPQASAQSMIVNERLFYVQEWVSTHPVRPDLQFRWDAPSGTPQKGQATFSAPGNEPVRLDLREGFPTDTAQSGITVGLPAFVWGPQVHVMDLLSLTEPVGSHIEQTVGRRPGHQKPLPMPWLVADATTGEQLATATPGWPEASPREVDAARHALQCGDLARYLRDIREPLTPRRFVANMIDSIHNTLFRIDRDTTRAEHELCG